MNTKLTLKYADADNYKQQLEVVIKGAITQEQVETINTNLYEQESIIAYQLGLPTVSELFADEFDFPSDQDHVFTTLGDFEWGTPKAEDLHTDEESTYGMSVDCLVKNIDGIEWDITAEATRLGLPGYKMELAGPG